MTEPTISRDTHMTIKRIHFAQPRQGQLSAGTTSYSNTGTLRLNSAETAETADKMGGNLPFPQAYT